MAMPRKLKLMNLFNEGQSYLGETTSVTLPPLKKLTEPFRAGGMLGPVKTVLGLDAIDVEWTCGGYMEHVVRQFGVIGAAGLMLRWTGAYQRGDDERVDAVEVVVRGFHEEIGGGERKTGEDTEFSVKTACSYYKEVFNGETLLEIDFLNSIWVVDGVDVMAAHRAAIGV